MLLLVMVVSAPVLGATYNTIHVDRKGALHQGQGPVEQPYERYDIMNPNGVPYDAKGAWK